MYLNFSLPVSTFTGILQYGELLPYALVFITTYLLVSSFINQPGRASTLPPGPWHMPFIGSFQLFTTASHIEVTKLCSKFGKTFTLYIGSDPLVVLNDLHMIKEALVKHANVFSDRASFKPMERTIKIKGSLVFENGTAWKARRCVVLKTLHNLTGNQGNLQQDINKEVGFICQEIEKLNGQPFDPSSLISIAASNIICSMSYGRRFSYDNQSFRKILTNIDKVLHCSFVETFLRTIPIISSLPGINGFRKAMAEILDFNLDMVKEHKATFQSGVTRDVIDAMLIEAQKEQEGTELVFADELIARSLFDFFGAGTDTTINTLRWALLLITQFPNIQAKVQQEIDDVIGGSRTPSMDDQRSMPYTMATIMETQRYRVASPFVPPRCTNQDFNIQGTHIPKGTQIWVNLWAVLHDPMLWVNPGSFDPTRFLADNGKRVVVPEAFIPFGAGRRICLGKKLSSMQIFIFFTNVLQKFTLSWPSQAGQPDLRGELGLTLAPKSYSIRAQSRHSQKPIGS
ncbi:cytochrome P450 2U1-like [Asterias amurensis]|uniref:cytochrome P450 2U1-like n=1 Tax=Asterias amurensis TaxID=7602 RepID=UPI003AB4F866